MQDEHAHYWSKEGGAKVDDSTLRVHSADTELFGGAAAQLNAEDPEWWWRPTVSATVNAPKIQMLNTGTGNWDDQNWDNTFGDSGPGSISTVQPTGQETAPTAAASSSPLNQRATFTLPLSADGTQYRVMWALSTSVTASSDNASVAGWTQGLHMDLASSVSDADPDDDFDLLP